MGLRAERAQRGDEDESVKREDVTGYPISRFAYTAMKKARGQLRMAARWPRNESRLCIQAVTPSPSESVNHRLAEIRTFLSLFRPSTVFSSVLPPSLFPSPYLLLRLVSSSLSFERHNTCTCIKRRRPGKRTNRPATSYYNFKL